MRHLYGRFIPVFALLLAACFLAQPAAADPRKELEEVDRVLSKAWQAQDLDTLLSFYDDKAVAVWTGSPAFDKKGLREFWQQRRSDPAFRVVSGRRDRFVISESGDMAYMQGTSSYRVTRDGRPVVETGSWVTLWQKLNGQWKIVYDSFNQMELKPEAAGS